MGAWWCGDDERVDVRQSIVDVGVGGNAVIDLLTPVIDASEALVYPDDRRHTGCGPEHAYMPRPPVTHADDAYPESLRLDRHIVPLCPVHAVLACRSRLSGSGRRPGRRLIVANHAARLPPGGLCAC